MPTRTTLGTKIQEGETFTYSATIVDEAGVVVDLTAATVDAFVHYYVKATGASINSRNNQQVVTAGSPSNEHTVTAGGVVTWKATTSDNPAIAADTVVVYRLTVTYTDGAAVARTAIHEVEFTLEDLSAVT